MLYRNAHSHTVENALFPVARFIAMYQILNYLLPFWRMEKYTQLKLRNYSLLGFNPNVCNFPDVIKLVIFPTVAETKLAIDYVRVCVNLCASTYTSVCDSGGFRVCATVCVSFVVINLLRFMLMFVLVFFGGCTVCIRVCVRVSVSISVSISVCVNVCASDWPAVCCACRVLYYRL